MLGVGPVVWPPRTDVSSSTRARLPVPCPTPEARLPATMLAGGTAADALAAQLAQLAEQHLSAAGWPGDVHPLMMADRFGAEHEDPSLDVIGDVAAMAEQPPEHLGVLGADRQDLFPSTLIED
jgi:hypothetical protein